MAKDDWDDDEEHGGFGFDLSPFLDLPPDAIEQVHEAFEKMRTPLAPGDPRRHHFIPESFQLRFADGNGQLLTVSVENPSKRHLASTHDTAVMKDLYLTVHDDIGETAVVERLLAVVDGDAVQPIERLSFGAIFPPKRSDRVSLALWLSFMYFRDPRTRRQMEMMTDQLFKSQLSLITDADRARSHLRKMTPGTEPDDEQVAELLGTVADLDRFEIVPHQNELIEEMLDIALKAMPFFLVRQFSVVKFPEPGLILSDRPIFLHTPPEHRTAFMGIGLATADEIWFPLDRRTLLILHLNDGVGETVMNAVPWFTVDAVNQVMVAQANREVYCHPDDVGRLDRLKWPDQNVPLMQMSGGGWIKANADGVNSAPKRKQHQRYRPQPRKKK